MGEKRDRKRKEGLGKDRGGLQGNCGLHQFYLLPEITLNITLSDKERTSQNIKSYLDSKYINITLPHLQEIHYINAYFTSGCFNPG